MKIENGNAGEHSRVHKTSKHGASGGSMSRGGSADIRIHGERKLGRLLVWEERGGEGGGAGGWDKQLGDQVQNCGGDSDGPAVHASDEAGTAGAQRPEARKYTAGPQLREQDKRCGTGEASAGGSGGERNAVPRDGGSRNVLLHRSGVPANRNPGSEVGCVFAGNHYFAAVDRKARDGLGPPGATLDQEGNLCRDSGPIGPELAPPTGPLPCEVGTAMRAAETEGSP